MFEVGPKVLGLILFRGYVATQRRLTSVNNIALTILLATL
jgi:hypothetical protein